MVGRCRGARPLEPGDRSAGWWLALAHLGTAVALTLTIIGIPLAPANLKLIRLWLVPLGREIGPVGAGQDPRYPVVR